MTIIANSAVIITRFANALYGFQLGKLTYDAVQADVGRAGLDATLNGYYQSSFGTLSNAQVTTKLLANLGIVAGANGLTADNVAAASGYILGQLNGATAANRGAVVKNILDLWANIGDDTGLGATYGAAASAWNAQVSNGMEYTAGHAADAPVNNNAVQGTFNLTNGSDTATANIFNSTLVYNPAGTDRINALQSEDVLTGTGTNPTLNATLGNANDNGASTVTPTLKGIETINLSVTGNTATLDARFADSLKTLSINKVTAEASNGAKVTNINQPAANLTVKDSANVDNNIAFVYSNGVLVGNADSGTLTLSNVQAKPLHVGNEVGGTDTEGFETLTVHASNTNVIKSLEAIDLENLKIDGSGTLSFLNTTKDTDRVKFVGGGLDIGDGLGIRSIDASAFTGTLNLDVTAALGGHTDPANSGSKFYATVVGGKGNDTFWTSASLAGTSATLRDSIDGGDGANKLVAVDANISKAGSVKNVQSLDLRLQGVGGPQEAYLSAFDAALTSVTVRNEQKTGSTNAVAGTFNLREVGTNISAINLLHASGAGAPSDTVNVALSTSTGANDTVVINVKPDLNISTTYDYTIGLETEAAKASATPAVKDANRVENLTINDLDTEGNTVGITGNANNANDLTGTLTLTGGSAGNSYKVTSTLVATTIDAAAQKSNLFLKTAPAVATVQTVKLGTGSDVLLFANDPRDAGSLDLLKGSEVITDAGGADVVTAVFSKDVTGQLSFTDVETFQTAATANVSMDLTKTGLTTLNLLSDQAVDGATGPSDLYALGAAAVIKNSIITATGTTAMATLNFAGSNEDAIPATEVGFAAQVFNGVTLSNSAPTLTINVNSKAVGTDNATHVEAGASSYTIGQITSQGTTTMNIAVADEKDSATVTAFDGIFAKNLTTLKVTSGKGDVNLGTVTGAALNNNLTTLDASGVKGATTATVIALADNAVVTLAAGSDVFSALGSSGKNIVIHGGNGTNQITGSSQSDIIDTGTGNDTVNADRGDNSVTTGAGNDNVTGGDGNNVINIGSGTWETVHLNFTSGNDATRATNVVAGNGTVAELQVDITGNGLGVGDLDTTFAVGAGNDLTMSFTGSSLNGNASTLNGRLSEKAPAATVAGSFTIAGTTYTAVDANSHLLYSSGALTNITTSTAGDVVFGEANVAYNINTGAGNDAIVLDAVVATAGQVTGGTGADKIVLNAAAAITVNVSGGDSSAADAGVNADAIYGYTTGTDIINFTGAAVTVGVAAAVAISGKAQISGTGVASFFAGETFAQHITSVANALGSQAIGASAVWTELPAVNGKAHTYLYITDGIAGASSSDVLIELVGVTTGVGLTVVGGDITAIA